MSTIRMAAKVDSRGRLFLPRRLRDSMQLSAGDTLSLEYEPDSGIMRLTKATSPLAILAGEAKKEFGAGKTMNIREYARKRGDSGEGWQEHLADKTVPISAFSKCMKVSESLSRIHAAVKDSGASSATIADAIREARSRQPK